MSQHDGTTVSLRPITELARELKIAPDHLEPYGRDKAKVRLDALAAAEAVRPPGKLILVSAITPTPAGEGKTTTSIGLAQGLCRIGKTAALALRQPSMGPVFGRKGGATGGGASRVEPSNTINLQFTGDFHAITAAHNLLAAAIDNRLHFGDIDLDSTRVLWKRALDMNDRALRHIVIGLGGSSQGVPRESGFDITAASEVMAILCLSDSSADLRARLDRILVGYSASGQPVLAKALGVTGAMAAILNEALMPNLVQTTESTPAFIHGGPFANIAHGCNSILATRMALATADYAVTEAGFAFDLGGEKFFDLKCRAGGFNPAAIVLVATVRALKMHGGVELGALKDSNPAAVERGLDNLAAHLDSAVHFGKPTIVAINQFGSDTLDEINVVHEYCAGRGVAVRDGRCLRLGRRRGDRPGPQGGRRRRRARDAAQAPLPARLAGRTKDQADRPHHVRRRRREHPAGAAAKIKKANKLGYGRLPICMAKTQDSLSDNPKLRGRPAELHVDGPRYRDRRRRRLSGRAHRRDRAHARPARTARRGTNRRR